MSKNHKAGSSASATASKPNAKTKPATQGKQNNQQKATTQPSQSSSRNERPNAHVTGSADQQSSFRASILNPAETWWQMHAAWLAERGYTLRPRYGKAWAPSWKRAGLKQSALLRARSEDGQIAHHPYILDAIKSDGRHVCLKRIRQQDHPREIKITQQLAEKESSPLPDNHCVQVYEILYPPTDKEWVVIVMPLLLPFDAPPWETIGEAAGFCYQLFEGMNYIHGQGVAHRDCTSLNVMMDASNICPAGFHPVARHMNREFNARVKFLTRTQSCPKYYYIDFGLSEYYDKRSPIARFIGSGDKTVPEFQGSKREQTYDPYAADVYMLGNLIRTTFLQGPRRSSFGFLEALIAQMTSPDPKKRPTISNAFQSYKAALSRLPEGRLRSRIAGSGGGIFAGISHWLRHRKLAKLGFPAIPVPNTKPNTTLKAPKVTKAQQKGKSKVGGSKAQSQTATQKGPRDKVKVASGSRH